MLFLVVMEAVSSNVRGGLPWEILYADDLVLLAESLEELKERLVNWKKALESKGLKVNMNKTKIMVGQQKMKEQVKGKYPCAVCGRGVGRNSIKCMECAKWVHKTCSRIKGNIAEKKGKLKV